MTEELKPCPFCGSEAIYTKIDGERAVLSRWCKCETCDMVDAVYSVDYWQSRPIEDALRAELAASRPTGICETCTAKALKELEKAREQIAAMREALTWTPITEKLPAETNYYWVLYNWGETYGAENFEEGGNFSEDVTHWMKMIDAPEPPQ